MNEPNSAEISLNDQTKSRLNEINKIKDYFNIEIQEKKTMSKNLSKYIAAFDYIDKNLIVLSATFGDFSWISKRKFYSCIFFSNRNNKEIIENNKKEKEKTLLKLLYLLKAN